MNPTYLANGQLLAFDVHTIDKNGMPVTINAANVVLVHPHGDGASILFTNIDMPLRCSEPYEEVRAMFRGLNEWIAWEAEHR